MESFERRCGVSGLFGLLWTCLILFICPTEALERKDSWHSLHIDANSHQHVDRVFARIRRLADVFVDHSEDYKQNSESNDTATTLGFNVSVDTIFGVDYGNQTASEDTSSVLFTKNDQTHQVNESSTTKETVSTRNPIRIRVFLSQLAGGGQHLTDQQRGQLFDNIITPAVLSWSAALRVKPVPLFKIDDRQLLNNSHCGPGPPSVPVPPEHWQQGLNETDFVLYIDLAFTNTTTPTQTDTISSKNLCSGEFLAAAAICNTDTDTDRPTAALLHMCIDETFFEPLLLQTNILLLKHEIGHALGFNSVSLAHFRRPDGSPYTTRDENGTIPYTTVECTGPVGNMDSIQLPSPELLQFRTVRGVRVAEVVTPRVRQAVRNHFDCQDLPGAELESGEFLPTISDVPCLGDHWERRLFKSDIMNPLIDETQAFHPRFSTVTLAYFADSGWYQVDLSRATVASSWGRAAGCEFVEQTCLQDGKVPAGNTDYFCNKLSDRPSSYAFDIDGCSPDLTRKASCSTDTYDGDIPLAYQYFNVSSMGGNDPYMDYCPIYTGFVNGRCSDAENESLIRVNTLERIGRRNSRCLSGRRVQTVTDKKSDSWRFESESMALCLPIACVVEDKTLRVQVGGIWEICHEKDQVIVPKESAMALLGDARAPAEVMSVICPDPVSVCPTFFCNRDCLGTDRICDYSVGRCVCPGPRTGSPTTNANLSSILFDDTEADDESAPCHRHNETENEVVPPGSVPALFLKPERKDDPMPESDSSLADIYVPRARNLRNENDGFWKRPRAYLSSFFSGLLVVMMCAALLVHRRRGRGLGGPPGFDEGNGGDPPGSLLQREKDKMVASFLVQLRVDGGARRDQLPSRHSETEDSSVFDTDASFDATSLTGVDFPPTIVDLSEQRNIPRPESLHGTDEELMVTVDPLASPPRRFVRRRPYRPRQF